VGAAGVTLCRHTAGTTFYVPAHFCLRAGAKTAILG
jgi:hypothetical protein